MFPRIYITEVLFSLMCTCLYAQENADLSLKLKRNYIIGIGSFESLSINYERNIIQWTEAFTNLRIGYGGFNDLQGGGKMGSATLVHLFGKKGSHLELNLGIRYYVNSKNNLWPSAKHFSRDIFAGYRYEKPDGTFVFRIGYFYPSIYAIAIGFGIKF